VQQKGYKNKVKEERRRRTRRRRTLWSTRD